MSTERFLGPADMFWLRALIEPQCVGAWSLRDWDLAVRMARRHRLLARLASRIESAGLGPDIPEPVMKLLLGAQRLSAARMRAMLWAIEQLPTMLDQPSFPLVLLKGAAYCGQELPIAAGRLPSDLDILVPKPKLPEVRFRLEQAGWREPALDPKDRQYYLEWSHELPPMRHERHAIELDVHHNILPPRAGRVIDADQFLARLRMSQWPSWQVLSPADQLLHSAGHLFFDAEPTNRVRDLVDMDGLFRHFGAEPTFWPDLLQYAADLGLLEPLFLAVHFTRAWLGTPIPDQFVHDLYAAEPITIQKRAITALMGVVLKPGPVDRPDAHLKRLAATVMLTRYHWNRLPFQVLLPHLWRKWRAEGGNASLEATPPNGTGR